MKMTKPMLKIDSFCKAVLFPFFNGMLLRSFIFKLDWLKEAGCKILNHEKFI